MRAILLLSLLALNLAAGEHPDSAAAPQSFVVGISPFLENSVKDEVYRGLVRLLVQELPLNSTVTFYDAFELRTITQIKLPNAHVFDSPKTRANQFASALGELKRFLAENHLKPKEGHLKFDGAIRLPQFCDFLRENLPTTQTQPRLLFVGSPLYQDEKEPSFSMVDGYFPSDGHLQAPREKSIFGITNDETAASPFVIDWIYFKDPWPSDLYKEKVTRFWTLYLERRGGRLATFGVDLPTALQGFCQPGDRQLAANRHWAIDPLQTKVEMLRIGREVELADWIQRDTLLETAQRAPSVLSGPMKIGIRWKDNIDLDLYATPKPGAETLFFQHPHSADGYYYKDHRASPGREYEFIEFERPVDAREVEAFVNFYKGFCPSGPRGEVRIEFDGRIYSAPFSIAASEGNRGRSGNSQRQCWDRIPVQQILKIARGEVN